MAKRHKRAEVTTIEGLAGIIAEGFSDANERFDTFDKRFDTLELKMRNGFEELRRILERMETRLAAIELAVFGATGSDGGRLVTHSLLTRLARLERVVFKK